MIDYPLALLGGPICTRAEELSYKSSRTNFPTQESLEGLWTNSDISWRILSRRVPSRSVPSKRVPSKRARSNAEVVEKLLGVAMSHAHLATAWDMAQARRVSSMRISYLNALSWNVASRAPPPGLDPLEGYPLGGYPLGGYPPGHVPGLGLQAMAWPWPGQDPAMVMGAVMAWREYSGCANLLGPLANGRGTMTRHTRQRR